jgi:uncharacterized membrane protein (DUF106 family)
MMQWVHVCFVICSSYSVIAGSSSDNVAVEKLKQCQEENAKLREALKRLRDLSTSENTANMEKLQVAQQQAHDNQAFAMERGRFFCGIIVLLES